MQAGGGGGGAGGNSNNSGSNSTNDGSSNNSGSSNAELMINGTQQQHASATGNIAGRPVHYLHELPHAAEERYAELFKQLDRNGKTSMLPIHTQQII